MSANAYLLERETRHAIFVQRYAGGVWNDLKPILRSLKQDLLGRLSNAPSEYQAMRIAQLLTDVKSLTQAAGNEMRQQLENNLIGFAQYEAEFQGKLLSGAITTQATLPTAEALAAVVTRAPAVMVGQSETVGQMVERFARGVNGSVQTAIQAGYIEGATVKQISRNVSRLVDTRSARQAEALVRTAVNHIGSEARAEVYKQNSDVLQGEKYTATLDSRTTLTCAGFDGKIFPVGEGPQTPQHYNCRSVRVPVVKPEFQLPGFEGERASVSGPVSSKTTYNSFLKRQSKEFQDEVLGPERAKLFRAGLNVDKFTDNAGRVLTLDELRAREGITLAGINTPVAPPVPKRTFAYESFKPVRNAQEANAFMVANGIAERADLKGLSVEALNKILPASQEVVERFNLKPMSGFGPATRFGLRTPRDAVAAVFPRAKVFHAPTTLGKKANLLQQKRLAEKAGDWYYDNAKARLDNAKAGRRVGPNIDEEVFTRFEKLDRNRIGHTVGSRGDIDANVAITVYHEYGHIVHLVDDKLTHKIEYFLADARPTLTGWDHLVSKYAGANPKEYVAEAFAIYMGEPESQQFRIHPDLLKIFKEADAKK